MLPPDVLSWIERQSGGRVTEIEQQVRWRPHHFVTIQRPDGTVVELLARSGRTQVASAYQAHFDIAHEARVLAALQGRGLKVPEFLGFNEDHGVILMERLAGTNDLSHAPSETQRRVMYEYVEQLAKVHSLDIEVMQLSDIEVPSTAEQIAFAGKFSFMEAAYAAYKARALRPEPLLELGIWWLHANVPPGDRSISFLQGDTGPGQFMFAEGHLTGLIDWELAHIGDPMLDLGVARMRNMLYPTGPLREPIEHYAEVTGRPIDQQALSFYTVLSMLLTPMGVSESIQRPSATTQGMLPRYGWDATLRRGLCDALAEALAFEIDPPELPEPATDELPSLVDYLVDQFETNCAPLVTDPVGAYEMSSAIAIARTLQLERRIGAELLDDDLDDMEAVLGERPRDRADGCAQLSELVARDPADHVVDLVSLFGRIERRREHLLKPMMIAQESGEFERLMNMPGALA